MVDVVGMENWRLARVLLRSRVVEALNGFIAARDREDWMDALSAHEFRLLIDEDYNVSVAKLEDPAATRYVYADALGNLRLDPWAMGLGGMLKEVALEDVADAVARALDRPEWWVP